MVKRGTPRKKIKPLGWGPLLPSAPTIADVADEGGVDEVLGRLAARDAAAGSAADAVADAVGGPGRTGPALRKLRRGLFESAVLQAKAGGRGLDMRGLSSLLGLGKKVSPLGRLGGIGLGAAGVAGLLGEFGPDLVEGAAERYNLGGAADSRFERVTGAEDAVARFAAVQAVREKELARLKRANTIALAQNMPHLFNQIMAGRRLPQDAVVIGGQPRTDILDEVVGAMSEGAFTPDPGL